jgi:signal transduction histidine kinase
VTTCRFRAQELAPLREHQNSLVEALRGLAAESTGRAGGPKVLFSEDSSAPSLLSQEVNNQLYRIAQEALNNALKHSGAHLVQIHLCVDRLKVELRISDDGRGFGASPPILRGMGMQTMRDRAAAVGGRLSISTDGLRGTVVDCACHNRLTPVAIDKISDIHAATMR